MIPKAAPKAAVVGIALGVVLCAIGVVAGRDALIEFGGVTGAPWIGPSIDAVLDLRARTWMLPVGIVVAVLGVVSLVLAVLPARRTHRPAGADGVWVGRSSTRRRVSSTGRGVVALDRFVAAVTGLAAIAVGLGAIAWQQGRLPDRLRDARGTVDGWNMADWPTEQWWPFAATALAVVTLVVGLCMLVAHLPRRQRRRVTVPDRDRPGSTDSPARMTVDLASAARNAAFSLQRLPGIESARGQVTERRNVRIVRIFGTATDPAGVVDAASTLHSQCEAALAGLDIRIQVLLDVDRAAKNAASTRSIPS